MFFCIHNFFKSLFLLFFTTFLLSACGGGFKLPGGDAKKNPPNAADRVAKNLEEGKGFRLNDLTKKGGGGNFEFASSNVLWRATLKSLDFLPLLNADYSGGIIIYDWYSQTNNPKEQIKISVQFLNNELRSDSIKITAHKKICETLERCSNSTLDQNFANSIKESIIISARSLKVEEAKKEKK